MAWTVSSIRFGYDGASSITWADACDTNVLNIDRNLHPKLIISTFLSSSDHSPGSHYFSLRAAIDGGSFELITSTTSILRGISAGCITNNDPVGSSAGCQTLGSPPISYEIENESPLTSPTVSPAKNEFVEFQWCIDISQAPVGSTITFDLYDETAAASIGAFANSISIKNPGPVIHTYDSSGYLPDGVTATDYSSLATWESATEKYLDNIYVLECYDSQDHNDSVTIAGATNQSKNSKYRVITSSPYCNTPFDGRPGTGAHINYSGTSADTTVALNESYARTLAIEISHSGAYSGTAICVSVSNNNGQCIKTLFTNSYNATFNRGFNAQTSSPSAVKGCYFCTAIDIKNYCFYVISTGGSVNILNCSAIKISYGTYGFYESSPFSYNTYFSCYAYGFATNGFIYTSATPHSNSDYNASDNATDLDSNWGTYYTNSLNLAPVNGIASVANTVGRNPATLYASLLPGVVYNNTDSEEYPWCYTDVANHIQATPLASDSAWPVGSSIPQVIKTYDSQVSEGKDYSSLNTWEAAYDIDLNDAIHILDCYDSQTHNDYVNCTGASGLHPGCFRMLRSAEGCAIPFAGRKDTGAYFNYTGTTQSAQFYTSENYFRLDKLSFTYSGAYSGTAQVVSVSVSTGGHLLTNLVICDSYNATTIYGLAYNISNLAYDSLIANVVAYNNKNYNISSIGSRTSADVYLINCHTAEDTYPVTAYNSYQIYSSVAITILWNNYSRASAGNPSDFQNATTQTGTDYNFSLDSTAASGYGSNSAGSIDLDVDATYKLITESNSLGYHPQILNETAYWDASGSEVSSIIARNRVTLPSWSFYVIEPVLFKDITGKLRSNLQDPDSSWSVGANELYEAPAGTTHTVSSALSLTITQYSVSIPQTVTHSVSAALSLSLSIKAETVVVDCTHAVGSAQSLSLTINATTQTASCTYDAGVQSLTLTVNPETVFIQESVTHAVGSALSLSITINSSTVAFDSHHHAGLQTLTITQYSSTLQIDCTHPESVQALTITQYSPTAVVDCTHPEQVQSLTITQYATTQRSDCTYQANSQSLSITVNPETVVTTGNQWVYPTAQALTLTINSATVTTAADVTVMAGAQTLTITQYGESLQIDCTHPESVQSINLTQYSPTVSVDVTYSASVQSLSLTINAESTRSDVTHQAGVQILALTQYAETVTADLNVLHIVGSVLALNITQYNETIQTGNDIVYMANKQTLSLSVHSATVVSNETVMAGIQVINLSQHSPSLNINATYNAGVQSLTLSQYSASLHSSAALTASLQSLSFSIHATSQRSDVYWTPSSLALTLTINPETVQTGNDIYYLANSQSLSFTVNPTTLFISASETVMAGSQAINITQHSATPSVSTTYIANAQTLTLDIKQESIVTSADIAAGTQSLSIVINGVTVLNDERVSPSSQSLVVMQYSPTVKAGVQVSAGIQYLNTNLNSATIIIDTDVDVSLHTVNIAQYSPKLIIISRDDAYVFAASQSMAITMLHPAVLVGKDMTIEIAVLVPRIEVDCLKPEVDVDILLP